MPKISALPVASAATGAELTSVVQDGVTKKLALSAYPISTATQTEIDAHEANTSNPHSVTKTQVGLGNVDNTSDATKNAAVATLTNKTIALTSNTLTNQKTETGTVSAPLTTQLNNTLFAHDFGAVGDGVTNDATAIQAFLTALAASKKEGRFDPGKTYYLSGADPTLSIPSGSFNTALYGFGARLLTDGSQFRTALKITNAAAVTRPDEIRKVLIDGLRIDQYQLASALYGIDVAGRDTHVTIRGCSFIAGSDNATPNYTGYAPLHFAQSNTADPNTGSFWCRVENCDFEGGATKVPFGVFIEGANNALDISRCTFAAVDKAIAVARAQPGADANSAVLVNGLRVCNNDFEDINFGIYTSGTSTFSTFEGFICHTNRIESVGNFFFSYNNDKEPFSPPIIGPNYVASGDWAKYISNPSAMKIDCRDEMIGKATINPASLAANATTTIGTISITPAATTDMVTIQVGGDLLGCQVTGYVSAANTVTIRLTNPTAAAIDVPSLVFTARVRRFF